tara:strand:+ start:747 stop:983 length:237 start_codon:yes stop_codon:yes gene_type:complete
MVKKVLIYSTDECIWCKKAKEFFKENKIKYSKKDVGKSKKNTEEMIKKSGQSGTPVIEIDEKIFIGFNEDKIKKALDL